MRSHNGKILTVVASIAVAVFSLLAFFATSPSNSGTVAPRLRSIDLTASVEAIVTDVGWSIVDGKTTQAMRILLDDGRTLVVPATTFADANPLVPPCTDFATKNACVLLADMLGDSVVWFALVKADVASGTEYLTLPGLVDMRDNGDTGVFSNGWTIRLATPTKRICERQDTQTLREFITLFPPDQATSTVNLTLDTVTAVSCVE